MQRVCCADCFQPPASKRNSTHFVRCKLWCEGLGSEAELGRRSSEVLFLPCVERLHDVTAVVRQCADDAGEVLLTLWPFVGLLAKELVKSVSETQTPLVSTKEGVRRQTPAASGLEELVGILASVVVAGCLAPDSPLV